MGGVGWVAEVPRGVCGVLGGEWGGEGVLGDGRVRGVEDGLGGVSGGRVL